jgi:hypothetical protein
MWISPRFHPQVIRAFDAMQRQPGPSPETLPAISYTDPVTTEPRAAIDRRAHALSLLQYERLREDITALVRYSLGRNRGEGDERNWGGTTKILTRNRGRTTKFLLTACVRRGGARAAEILAYHAESVGEAEAVESPTRRTTRSLFRVKTLSDRRMLALGSAPARSPPGGPARRDRDAK